MAAARLAVSSLLCSVCTQSRLAQKLKPPSGKDKAKKSVSGQCVWQGGLWLKGGFPCRRQASVPVGASAPCSLATGGEM